MEREMEEMWFKEWFRESLRHYVKCLDEGCEWWWAFNRFIKEKGIQIIFIGGNEERKEEGGGG